MKIVLDLKNAQAFIDMMVDGGYCPGHLVDGENISDGNVEQMTACSKSISCDDCCTGFVDRQKGGDDGE